MAEDKHQKEQPIIIKKVKKGGGHGHHGGAWKVAYADFVTAMMAFFIVMWILASSEEVKQQVSDYFNNPMEYSIFTGERKTGSIPVELDLADPKTGRKEDGKSDNVMKFDKETTDTLFNRIMQRASQDSVQAAQRVSKVSQEIAGMMQRLRAEKPDLTTVLENIKIEMTKEGLRIELLESSENCFFEIGSARLSKQAEEILRILGEEIGKLPNFVELEGHTDARAYKSSTGYTNWDLSTDRANSARKVLQIYGLWEGQLTKVTGFADQQLRTPDNPFDMTNRRVSILVKHISVNQFLPQSQEKAND
ncbi:MAG: OmpA family protein [Candidatus Kapabacteria bacterium]|nr:OmpA family protein [Ignavibacteriota bacterium]MCW5885965.1 OmpA family protein [Candidatus Kapabacteria bacterium]